MCFSMWWITFSYFSEVAGIFPEFLNRPCTTGLEKGCQKRTLFLHEAADMAPFNADKCFWRLRAPLHAAAVTMDV